MTEVFTNGGATVSVAGTTSTDKVQVAVAGTAERTVRVASPAANATAFIRFGDSTVVATTTTSMPLLPGTVEVFTVPGTHTHMAVITATGTATVYATPGKGA